MHEVAYKPQSIWTTTCPQWALFLTKIFTGFSGSNRSGKLLLVPCLALFSSQVSFLFLLGALPVHLVLFLLLPASLSVPEEGERAEAALTPLPLLLTCVVEILLRTRRQFRVSRALLSKRNVHHVFLRVLGESNERHPTRRDTQREGAPHLPPPSLAKEKTSPGSGKGDVCRPAQPTSAWWWGWCSASAPSSIWPCPLRGRPRRGCPVWRGTPLPASPGRPAATGRKSAPTPTASRCPASARRGGMDKSCRQHCPDGGSSAAAPAQPRVPIPIPIPVPISTPIPVPVPIPARPSRHSRR